MTDKLLSLFVNSINDYMKEGLAGVTKRLQNSAFGPELAATQLLKNTLNTTTNENIKSWFKHLMELSCDSQKHGKRFRARLTLVSSWAAGLPLETAISIGAFVEMIQTASLVHDDVVDDADTRRGKSTVKNSMGNRFAVLTGDYILSIALSELSRIDCNHLFSIFSSVVSQMTLGEAMELECIGNPNRELSHYFSSISLKTASLVSFSTYAPCIIANSEDKITENIKMFGLNLGILLQLVDDVLDFVGPDGKKVFKDIEQGLPTLPVLLLKREDIFSKPHDELMDMINQNSTLEKSLTIANDHFNKASRSLDAISNNIAPEAISYLKDICLEIFERLPNHLKTTKKGVTL